MAEITPRRKAEMERRQERPDDDASAVVAVALAAFTVPQFCAAHSISRALFYALAREGRAPAIIKAGRRTLISAEAAARWRRDMEAASARGAA